MPNTSQTAGAVPPDVGIGNHKATAAHPQSLPLSWQHFSMTFEMTGRVTAFICTIQLFSPSIHRPAVAARSVDLLFQRRTVYDNGLYGHGDRLQRNNFD